MKRVSVIFALAVALAAGTACAQEFKQGPIEVIHPWSRATPKGASTASGYVTIRNTGTTPDRLVGGSLAAAGRVEIHQMSMDQGVMMMREVTGGLAINPGDTLELKPGGYHLMFMQIKRPFVKGEPIKGTLVFEKSGTVDVEYAVEGLGATSGSSDHMHMH